jgi:hypothetical protein
VSFAENLGETHGSKPELVLHKSGNQMLSGKDMFASFSNNKDAVWMLHRLGLRHAP